MSLSDTRRKFLLVSSAVGAIAGVPIMIDKSLKGYDPKVNIPPETKHDFILTHEILDPKEIANQLSLPDNIVIHGTNDATRGLHKDSATGTAWFTLNEIIFSTPYNNVGNEHHVFGSRVVVDMDGKETLNRQKIAFRLFDKSRNTIWTKLSNDERGTVLAKQNGVKLVKDLGRIDEICREVTRVDHIVQFKILKELGVKIPGLHSDVQQTGVETIRGLSINGSPAIADLKDGVIGNIRREPIMPHIWVASDMVLRADVSPMHPEHHEIAREVLSQYIDIAVA